MSDLPCVSIDFTELDKDKVKDKNTLSGYTEELHQPITTSLLLYLVKYAFSGLIPEY